MRIIKNFLKVILAGIMAVAILCGIFSFYLVMPVHIENPRQNTDYVWPANSRWLKMTEGISWGRFDANGYNNSEVIENPDILILGSSHMEAINVTQDKNTASVLREQLGGKYTVYNMGISGHHFTKVCKYLPVTLSLFEETPDVIVIETSSTAFSSHDVNALLEGTVGFTASHSTGIVALLQKLPFCRLLYYQIDAGLLDLLMPEKVSAAESGSGSQPSGEVYDRLFRYITAQTADYDTQLVIFYHPAETIQEDGAVLFPVDPATAVFARKCEEYGITFIDMTDRFYEMYNESHQLPHGFVTGELGDGHLNADGHRVIAEALAEAMAELEEVGTLCK